MEIISIGRTDPIMHKFGRGAMCKPSETCREAELLSRKYRTDIIYVVHYTGYDLLYVPPENNSKMPMDAPQMPQEQRKT